MTQQMQYLMSSKDQETLAAVLEEEQRHQRQIIRIMTQMDPGTRMYNLEDEFAQHRARLVEIAHAAQHRVVTILAASEAPAEAAGIAQVVVAMSRQVVVPDALPTPPLTGTQRFPQQPHAGGTLPA